MIAKITDANGISYKINYINTSPYKVSKIVEYGLNNVEGASLTFDYGFMTTTITDNKGQVNTYTFNEYGSPISVTNLNNNIDLNNAYAKGQEYVTQNTNNKQINKAVNSLKNDILPIKYVKNLINDSSLENTSDASFFSYNRAKENPYSGAYSCKVKENGFFTLNVEEDNWYTFSAYFQNNEQADIQIVTSGVQKPE